MIIEVLYAEWLRAVALLRADARKYPLKDVSDDTLSLVAGLLVLVQHLDGLTDARECSRRV
jgi:hypothetical protein